MEKINITEDNVGIFRRFGISVGLNHCSRNRYTNYEEKMILEKKYSDYQLANMLGRSVHAIHNKRWRLRKEYGIKSLPRTRYSHK